MTASYQQLQDQIKALQAKAEEARKAELKGAIDKVRGIVAQYSLTREEVFAAPRKATGTVAPKYRDPATGATWTGRGKAPKWIEGQDREKFAI